MIPGQATPKRLAIPPSAGPTMKPSPYAAPINPIALARSAGGVRSARYACPTPTLASIDPATMRERRSATKLPARVNIRYDTAAPARERSITGRRPTRSLKRPQNGAERRCIAGVAATRRPISASLDSNRAP